MCLNFIDMLIKKPCTSVLSHILCRLKPLGFKFYLTKETKRNLLVLFQAKSLGFKHKPSIYI